MAQPLIDGPPVEVSPFHQTDDEVVVFHRIAAELETIQPEMHVGSGKGCAFVPIEKGVVLDEAFEEGSCLCDGVFVIARLGAKHRGFEGSKITNPIRASELVDQ